MSKRRRIVSKEKYKGKELSYEDYKASTELYWWIEDNIFRFKDDEGFSRTEGKFLALRIQGLITGQYIKNNNRELDRSGYTIEEISNTFKFTIMEIQYALDNYDFKDMKHKINYMMVIVENNINDMRERMKRVKIQEEMTNNIEEVPDAELEYKPKVKKRNKNLDDLF